MLCGVLLATAGGTTGASATEATATATTTSPATTEAGLEEITVTAERFTSTIQNTPISISALSGEELTKAGLSRIQDIARDVPGLSMRYASAGLTEYEARGLASNGGAAPTVGFYLDEIPLSPPAVSQSGKVVIDPNLYDVERVEILRGPQGTLYGSGSMGGTVKVLTNQPKLGTFEGSVQGTGSYTDGGSGNGGGNLMLNFPLGDQFAVRIVLSDLYRSGWIDNITVQPFPVSLSSPVQGNVLGTPVTNIIRKANSETLYSGRIALLYKPNDDLSILATAMTQGLHMGGYDLLDGSPNTAVPYRVYDAHYEAFPLREGIRDDISIFGLTVNANLGFADLTSATSYWGRLGYQVQDASESIYYSNQGGTPFVPVPYAERDPSHQLSQEIRLTSHDIGAWHWVAGAFYSSLHSVWNEIGRSPLNPTTPDGSYFISWNDYGVRQTALFADVSYKFNDQWKLAAGARYYDYASHQDEYSWGYDGPNPTPPANSKITTAKNSGGNPRVNLSYTPNPDLTVYTTISKGFRPGGANQILPPPTPAAVLPAGCPVVRAGFRVELRDRREGPALRQLAHGQQRRLLHQVDRYPAGAHAAVRLSVLRQCRRRPHVRTRARDQCQALERVERLAQRSVHGCQDHQPERLVHELPDERRSLPGRCDPSVPDQRWRLHRAHHERGQGHCEPVGRLCHERTGQLSVHGARGRPVRGILVRCGILLRI